MVKLLLNENSYNMGKIYNLNSFLDIKNIGYLTSMAFVRSDGIPTIIVSLYANYDGGEVKLQESMTEYA